MKVRKFSPRQLHQGILLYQLIAVNMSGARQKKETEHDSKLNHIHQEVLFVQR